MIIADQVCFSLSVNYIFKNLVLNYKNSRNIFANNKHIILGGLRNPVVQVCKKPNMMEDCQKKPPFCFEDPKESRRKFIRNLFLSLLFLAVFSYTVSTIS